MGGTVPLGYDPPNDSATRALVVNEAEAETVRLMFTTYLELGSVHELQRWLAARGIVSKARTTASGRMMGGLPFSRGALFHLLRNRLYLGMIVHKTASHSGAHSAIVDPALFDAVQTSLDGAARRHDARPNRVATAPLARRLFDAEGNPMSPTFSHGARGQVYRYYVSAPLQQGQRAAASNASTSTDAIRRVPAVALEAKLADIMRRLLPRADTDPLVNILRVEVYPASLHILLPIALLSGIRSRIGPGEITAADAADPSLLRLELQTRMRLRSGRTIIEAAAGSQPTVSRRDPVLIKALRAAHALLTPSADGMPHLVDAPTAAYPRRLVRLAFLAPEIQAAILEGRQPAGLTLDRLIRMPLACSWAAQMAAFGA